MKALVCEMCNSSDILKQDGYFVCQSCGMKYSPEEAKKMMVEGTVKFDNSEFVQKYLLNARRAKKKEDWEETEKYYNMVEQNDPTNVEAIFYSSYGKAKASLVDDNIFKREAVFKTLINSVSVLDDNFDPEKSRELVPIIAQITTDVISLLGSEFVYNIRRDSYGIQVYNDSSRTYKLFVSTAFQMLDTLEEIFRKVPVEDKDVNIFILKQELRIARALSVSRAVNIQAKRMANKMIPRIEERIKTLNPVFQTTADKYYQKHPRQKPGSSNTQTWKIALWAIFGISAIFVGSCFICFILYVFLLMMMG